MINVIAANKIQYFAVASSFAMIFFILELIRKKKLKEEYSLLWLFFGGLFLFFSLWRKSLDYLAQFIGIEYPPAAIFLVLFAAMFSILIHYSTVISKMSDNIKNLVQELGLLELELKNIKREKDT